MNARFIAIVVCAGAPAVAIAQGAAANVADTLGSFFKPQAPGDVSLTHMGEPQLAQAQPATPQPQPQVPAPQPQAATPPPQPSRLQAQTVAPVRTAPNTTVVIEPAAGDPQVEREADRVEREAQRVQMQNATAPRPINGAFTGLTDPRDR